MEHANKIALTVDVWHGPYQVPLMRPVSFPFAPVPGVEITLGDGGHPTCRITAADYQVDRDEWLVSARLHPSCVPQMLWTILLLVGRAHFGIVDFEHAPEHPLLEDDVFVEHPDNESLWVFREEKIMELHQAWAKEWDEVDRARSAGEGIALVELSGMAEGLLADIVEGGPRQVDASDRLALEELVVAGLVKVDSTRAGMDQWVMRQQLTSAELALKSAPLKASP